MQSMQHIHIRTHIPIQLPLRTRKSWPETLADTKFIYKHKKQDLSNATCVWLSKQRQKLLKLRNTHSKWSLQRGEYKNKQFYTIKSLESNAFFLKAFCIAIYIHIMHISVQSRTNNLKKKNNTKKINLFMYTVPYRNN